MTQDAGNDDLQAQRFKLWELQPWIRSTDYALWTMIMSAQLHRIASDLDPGPGNPAGIPASVLEAAKDMADYLDGERTPPESNRNGIPHTKD